LRGPPHPRKELTGIRNQPQQPTTVALLGANTLVDQILARLLEQEGYNTKLLEAYPTGPIDELLDGVDVLLLSPELDADLRGAFLDAMRSTPEAAHKRVPVLSLSVPLRMALLDELSVNVSWQSLFRGLVQEIEDALRRAEASAQTLPVDVGEPPPKGIPRSEAECA
jgi:hypothetical protein